MILLIWKNQAKNFSVAGRVAGHSARSGGRYFCGYI